MMRNSRLLQTRLVYRQARALLEKIDDTLATLAQSSAQDERLPSLRSVREELGELVERLSPRLP